MKRMILSFYILLATGLIAFAQESERPLGVWKEQFASPTYGVALIPCEISDLGGALQVKKLVLPGLDLRLFQGTNVTKRGGFFTGYEFGAQFFSNKGKPIIFADNYTAAASAYTQDYNLNFDYTVGMVFLMGKYGYRLDIGFALIGLSLGAELGIGARLVRGDFNLSTTLSEHTRTLYAHTPVNPADLLIDAAAEAALRLGRNFRLIARLGAMLTPDFYEGPDHNLWYADPPGPGDIGNGDTDWTDGEIDALLQRYVIYLPPLIPSARVGFSLSY